MKSSRKKIVPYAAGAIVLILLVIALVGQDQFRSDSNRSQLCDVCEEPPVCSVPNCDPGCLNECAPQANPFPSTDVNTSVIENVHCLRGGNLAPHYACGGVTTTLDFLYWKANEDGLEYGTKMVAGPLIGRSSQNNSRLLDLNFKWNPGFRLGVGYLFDRFDHWNLGLKWTYIRNTAYGHAKARGIESQVGLTDTIVPPWVNLNFVLTAGASQAAEKWHATLNVLDLDLARSFFVSERLVINPSIGLRGAFIFQKLHAKYRTNFLSMESAFQPPRNVNIFAWNHFSSFGIRGGSEFLWHFDSRWNLFAKFSGSVLYGKFKVQLKDINDQGLGEGEIPPEPLDFRAKEQFWRTRLNFEESIGIAWETFFKKGIYHLSARASYELSQWLSQNQLFYSLYFRGTDTIFSLPIRNQGNLGYQGVTAGVDLDY